MISHEGYDVSKIYAFMHIHISYWEEFYTRKWKNEYGYELLTIAIEPETFTT